MYLFLYYSYYAHSIEEIVCPSEVYSTMRTMNITKSQFDEFFKNNDVIKLLKDIRNFKMDKMISDLYEYIPQIDEFFNYIEKDEHLPFSIPNRGNTSEEKIHAFLSIVYQLIVHSKIGTYADFLNRTVQITNPLLVFLGVMSADETLKAEESIRKRNEMLKKYIIMVAKDKNYRNFFGNEEKRLNFVADKTIKKLAKLYDMAKDEKSSIVNWDLHHKINKTAEKTIEEVKKLFREGKLKIVSPTENDLKFIKGKKPKQ